MHNDGIFTLWFLYDSYKKKKLYYFKFVSLTTYFRCAQFDFYKLIGMLLLLNFTCVTVVCFACRKKALISSKFSYDIRYRSWLNMNELINESTKLCTTVRPRSQWQWENHLTAASPNLRFVSWTYFNCLYSLFQYQINAWLPISFLPLSCRWHVEYYFFMYPKNCLEVRRVYI